MALQMKRTQTKEYRWPLKTGKGKEADSPPRTSRRNTVLLTLKLNETRLKQAYSKRWISSIHEYDTKTRNHVRKRVQMQEMGTAFEMKRPATQSNYIYIVALYLYIKRLLYQNFIGNGTSPKTTIDTHT